MFRRAGSGNGSNRNNPPKVYQNSTVLSPVREEPSLSERNNSTVLNNNEDNNARVRVIIRIRPLTTKEESKGYKNIIEGQNNQITVWDPTCFEVANKPELIALNPACWSRDFAFDKCLFSNKSNRLDNVNQDGVFEEVGQPILDWILAGFNCCVFAFGQTGAGKSYTMMGDVKGDPNNYGLIPRICFGLFEALEANNESLLTGQGASEIVSFSHLEIYNENVKDLLAPASSEYLKVREHPKTGVFVSNLTTVRVTKFEDVMSLIAIGDKKRFVASTQMNSHSSRSHAIVTLTVIRNSRNAPKHGLPTTALQQKIGRVHLVDLAGSERVTLSGAKGERLKEANHINKSLSVLGDVIKCLGDSANKNHRGAVHVPYRNSTLTMLLKDSLGGNSHAIMIAAVSPGSFDYEETISTLKYADRAKRVRMRVDANVTSGLNFNDNSALELVPILQAEVSKLKEMLKQQQIQQLKLQNISLESSTTEVLKEMRERVLELENQLAEREQWIASANEKEKNRFLNEAYNVSDVNDNDRSYSQLRLSLTDNITANSSFSEPNVRSKPVVVLSEDAVDISLPRVINLNQDPLFSECLVYYVPEGKVLAGAKESQADILLSGPDVIAEHAILHHDSNDGHVLLEVLGGALVFVNGEIVDSISNINYNNKNGTKSFGPLKLLKHYDRIAFGRFHLFRYEAKGQSNRRFLSTLLYEDGDALTTSDSINSNSSNNHIDPPGWEYAQEELMRKNEGVSGMMRSPIELYSLDNRINTDHINDNNVIKSTSSRNDSPPSKSFLSSMMLRGFSPKKDIVEVPQIKVEKQVKKVENNPTPPLQTKSPYRVSSPSLVPKISFTPPRNKHPSASSISDLPSLEKLPFNDDDNDYQRGPPSPPPPGPPPLQFALSPTIPTSLTSTLMDSMDNIDNNTNNENKTTPPTGKDKKSLNTKTADVWWNRVNRINEVKEQVIEPDLSPIMKSNVNKTSPIIKSSSPIIKTSPNVTARSTAGGLVIDKTSTTLQQQHSINNLKNNSISGKLSSNNRNINNNSNSIPGNSIPGIQSSRNPSQNNSTTSSNGIAPTVFEKEALALQQELAQMQKTLKERMEKYQVLTTFSLPN